MKNEIVKQNVKKSLKQVSYFGSNLIASKKEFAGPVKKTAKKAEKDTSEILFISSYPPRECGIATYSQDLIRALNEKFGNSLPIKVCALDSGKSDISYPEEVKYVLNTSRSSEYVKLANDINLDTNIKTVLIQHEFGLFQAQPEAFLQFLYELSKPVILAFHTVLPQPSKILLNEVKSMVAMAGSIIVMTHNASDLLVNDYQIPGEKITVIAHGTHLVLHLNADGLKKKYGLSDRKVLTTFGLLSAGKNIEVTIEALPAIVKSNPETIFLIIGKTHPEVVKNEGEKYREYLENLVKEKKLTDHVRFINKYLSLNDLLEYLQLTDIYLFTSGDPNQAVSGTFVYAMSCACPIISTPIPHAREMLSGDTGIIIDFKNSTQVSDNVIQLFNNEKLRKKISVSTLQKIVSTSWQNSAVAHAVILEKISVSKLQPKYNLPKINLNHLKQMTLGQGIIQFARINQPDIETGYTLDDNARALIAMCMHYQLTADFNDLTLIRKYLNFIKFCQQSDGTFLNYVDKDGQFTDQNNTNLNDPNGRAIWALGFVISKRRLLPTKLIADAKKIFQKTLPRIEKMNSIRAMSFAMKGLYFSQLNNQRREITEFMDALAQRLVGMFKQESSDRWAWYENKLTYANSIMPEAMLYAWLVTNKAEYRDIALRSLSFLLSETFNEKGIQVISNKGWMNKGEKAGQFGEQPIDVAYTIMTLEKFYEATQDKAYLRRMVVAFNWFLGYNRLNQIIYNPRTGGCYDGLEETHVNLNQGAESTVCYIMARLTLEKYKNDLI